MTKDQREIQRKLRILRHAEKTRHVKHRRLRTARVGWKAGVAYPLIGLCLNLCGGMVAFSPATNLDQPGRTWRV